MYKWKLIYTMWKCYSILIEYIHVSNTTTSVKITAIVICLWLGFQFYRLLTVLVFIKTSKC